MRHFTHVVFFSLLFLVCGLGMQVSDVYALPILCHQYDPNRKTPPAGFGLPYRPTDKGQLIAAECSKDQARILVGNGKNTQYIYERGYGWNGTQWEEFEYFPLGQKVQQWNLGSAEVIFNVNPDELEKLTHVVAYICEWDGSAWKCGCGDVACAQPMWQLQGFQRPKSIQVPDESWAELTDVLVQGVRPTVGSPGTRLIVSGSGFSFSNNEVVFVDQGDSSKKYSVSGLNAINGGSITVTVPASLPLGKYYLGVKNANGVTENGMMYINTQIGTVAPKITSISPTSGPAGTVVTIQGSGFTPTGNDVYTPYGPIRNLSLSNGSIRVTIDPYASLPALPAGSQRYYPDIPVSLPITVINTNGISTNPLSAPLVFTMTPQ